MLNYIRSTSILDSNMSDETYLSAALGTSLSVHASTHIQISAKVFIPLEQHEDTFQ